MAKQAKVARYSAHACRALAIVISLMGWIGAADGFTDEETREIYRALDPDNHGQVTRIQFQINKVNAFYFRHRPTARWEMKPLKFEETGLSRDFFDKVDKDHNGQIDSIEIIDAIRFEDIDTKRRGYFDFSDLVVYLNKIGR
jgi:dihydrodipicolinate synthase/N-acetylneuraminate lyase